MDGRGRNTVRSRKRWIVSLALGLGVASGCGESAPQTAAPEPAVSDDVVTLEAAQAAQLETALAAAEEAPSEVTAMGRVLDPLPLLQAWGALATARHGAENATRELARTRALAKDAENASARDLEAAALAASQADAALAQARAQVSGAWGSADPARLAPWAEALARGSAAVARIELPAGSAAPLPRSVYVSAPGLAMAEREAQLLGPAGAMDPSLQGPAFLVALSPDPPPPGAALSARLELEGASQRGVFLPASAVVWNEGAPLAFVAGEGGRFERRSLRIARPWRDGFLVSAGVAAGERFVSAGAQQLLSSQLVGGAKAE
jgi:membrane fusion protein, multidrug efflux system